MSHCVFGTFLLDPFAGMQLVARGHDSSCWVPRGVSSGSSNFIYPLTHGSMQMRCCGERAFSLGYQGPHNSVSTSWLHGGLDCDFCGAADYPSVSQLWKWLTSRIHNPCYYQFAAAQSASYRQWLTLVWLCGPLPVMLVLCCTVWAPFCQGRYSGGSHSRHGRCAQGGQDPRRNPHHRRLLRGDDPIA